MKPGSVRLTVRGWAMVGSAVVGVAAAYVLGWPTILLAAVFIAALVVIGAITLFVVPVQLRVERTIEPDSVEPGMPVQVRLRISGSSMAGEWRDGVSDPAAAIGVTGGVLPVIRRGSPPVEVRYTLAGSRRGVLQVGPLRVNRVDPFGAVVASRPADAAATLVVLPRVHAVLPPDAHVRADLDPAGSASAGPVGDQRDVIAREYRPGDAMRSVDWRSTARRGELMVRSETAVVAKSTVVLFDIRESVWGDEVARDPAQFEWAVECVASLLAASGERGAVVQLATDPAARPSEGVERGLRELATIAPVNAPRSLAQLVRSAIASDVQVMHLITGAAAEREIRDLPRPPGGTLGFVSVVAGPNGSGAHDGLVVRLGWRLSVLDASLSVSEAWQSYD